MDANGMRWCLAAGSACQQHCMQAACAYASQAVATSSTTGCKRHATEMSRRQLLPRTVGANRMRWCLAAGTSCQQQCLQAACIEAPMDASGMRRSWCLAAGTSCQQR
jgi:hypothetical protein